MENIKTFKPGDIVIKEGSKGSSAYVILSGSAKITKQVGAREITVASISEGQVFGEMGLIEDKPRSATVCAETALKTRVIDRERFNILLKENPSVLIPIMKSLFERLRQASEMLAESIMESPEIDEEESCEIILEGQTAEAKKVLDGRKLLITRFPFLIGRQNPFDPDSDVFYTNDLTIEEKKPYVVSRTHLSINNENGRLWVLDRGSTFGVIVNGREIGGSSNKSRALLDMEENQVIIGPATSKYIFLIRKSDQ
jgi:CRP/FNR family transcriptional regulator, cyclic AMP receptor protein